MGSEDKGGGAYLSNEAEHVEREAEIGAPDAADGLEGDLIERVALLLPGVAEADVGEADGAPGEERGETGQGQKPVEHGRAVGVEVDVGEGAKGEEEGDRQQRAAGAVDVAEALGRVALLSEGGKRAGAAVDGRDTDGENRDENDDVHEGVEALEVGVLADQDEGRGVDVRIGVGAQQVLIVVGNEETDEEQAKDVEEGDTPEDLLDGAGERLERVLRFSSGKADELSSGESKSGRDEDAAEAAEAVGKSTGVVPQTGALVLVVAAAGGAAAEDQDESNDHEDNNGAQLEHRRPKLLLGVAKGAKDVDDKDGDQEETDPDSCVKRDK